MKNVEEIIIGEMTRLSIVYKSPMIKIENGKIERIELEWKNEEAKKLYGRLEELLTLYRRE
jgi:hypothetical protein